MRPSSTPKATRPLIDQLRPCGPVIDPSAAERSRSGLADADSANLLGRSWPALAPIFSASPYLASLARLSPERLWRTLSTVPERQLESLLTRTDALAELNDLEAARRELRWLKADLHLLTALADLGRVWSLEQVTAALTAFADAALKAALSLAASDAHAKRYLIYPPSDALGPVPGFFCLAMGKHGAGELNYSSDIDITIFYHPNLLPLAPGVEAQALALAITRSLVETLHHRTADGYVFRIDLRLRPDPASTPAAMPVAAASDYYETVGQNWERAAFIKARAVAGDLEAGRNFLSDLQAFIWRRNLDFAAIADIHAIKRQIHTWKVDERLDARGADLKLGRGGIREIEFFVQTQQLILGGRHPQLRASGTLSALFALQAADQVGPDDAAFLHEAYVQLRELEHRAQMIADEQTHRLPEADNSRLAIAALWGMRDLKRFDQRVSTLLKGVNARYGQLFAGEEPLSSRFGSLVFTGVEDDPETLRTLARMGFSQPANIAGTIRGWHHGRIAATRTERGRELFTRLAPRLLDAMEATGAADAAFSRFSDFFTGLSSGVQIQSLFLAKPKLLTLIVEVTAFAPKLASTLARRPAVLDALMDPAFFEPFKAEDASAAFAHALQAAQGFEFEMDAARRVQREQIFRIGVQIMSGTTSAAAAGSAFADLADLCIESMAAAALDETHRQAGEFPGEVAIVALGKCGSREMSARSDVDLMAVYRADSIDSVSSQKAWAASTFYGRFTQRLIAALSARTAEGALYDVDMQLRPTGSQGPIAVSLAAFSHYYAGEAETWEHLALTRARVVWANRTTMADTVQHAIAAALRRRRDPRRTALDVLNMRGLLERERPSRGFWDLKRVAGGLIDIEFAVQYLQLIHAPQGGPLIPNTGDALQAFVSARLGHPPALKALQHAWHLQQNLTQLLKIALDDNADPEQEPPAFQDLLARAGQVRDFRQLHSRLQTLQRGARSAFERLLGSR